jgi:hypothetical protein
MKVPVTLQEKLKEVSRILVIVVMEKELHIKVIGGNGYDHKENKNC